MEVVIGTAHSGVVAYDLPNTANARILWGTGRGSYKRTGVSAAEESFSLTIHPSSRAIQSGGVATYVIKVYGQVKGTVTLAATSPSPDIGLTLTPKSFSQPGQAVLTLTDMDSAPPPAGLWYNVPIVATGNGLTRTVTAGLLVGGPRTYLPAVLK
jgi:hypothetical protein